MWVHEEIWHGMKLSEVINQQHENPKYLPGKKLPGNVVAVTDLVEACEDSDLLVFVVPHQFVSGVCKQLQGHLKEGALAISLIKLLRDRQGAPTERIVQHFDYELNVKRRVDTLLGIKYEARFLKHSEGGTPSNAIAKEAEEKRVGLTIG
ncbi:unnamed protein product [Toxocara canis]|uniref:NAD_Gly3P_dh_N domain-containing protein n=1 Tax=Toxocara canis TaxID=6265 RepID=A0A183U4J3_TOXCA|nr:unnamed protein product [Toxocara canis]